MNALLDMYIFHDVYAVASIHRDTRIEQFNTVDKSHIRTMIISTV